MALFNVSRDVARQPGAALGEAPSGFSFPPGFDVFIHRYTLPEAELRKRFFRLLRVSPRRHGGDREGKRLRGKHRVSELSRSLTQPSPSRVSSGGSSPNSPWIPAQSMRE